MWRAFQLVFTFYAHKVIYDIGKCEILEAIAMPHLNLPQLFVCLINKCMFFKSLFFSPAVFFFLSMCSARIVSCTINPRALLNPKQRHGILNAPRFFPPLSFFFCSLPDYEWEARMQEKICCHFYIFSNIKKKAKQRGKKWFCNVATELSDSRIQINVYLNAPFIISLEIFSSVNDLD